MNSQALFSSRRTISPSAFLQDGHRPVAPGFRFHPTEQELVLYYLGRKVLGKPLYTDVVPDLDVYKFEPHEVSGKIGGDIEWYFFSKLDKKYVTGTRVNRSTGNGFWKVTGPEYKIRYGSRVVGEKRFLVYYNRNSKMTGRTEWVMHEYRLTEAALQGSQARDDYALYKLFWKGNSKPIPKDPAAVTVEEGERVHDITFVPANRALQPSEELGPGEKNKEIILAEEVPQAAAAAYELVIRREPKMKTLDLLTNFENEGLYEHLEKTSSMREDTPTRWSKRPRNTEAYGLQILSPRAHEPSSSSSLAGDIPSLKLSLACLAAETAPNQQQQRQTAVPPQPVPQQAVEPLQGTSIPSLPNIRITGEMETVKGEPSRDPSAKDV